MEIRYESIILRDMIRTDIEDYVRWFTVQTNWSCWDAPWEPIDTDETAERESWSRYYSHVSTLPDDAVRWKFEIVAGGKHVGWVSSYLIDENYEWRSADRVKDGQTVFRAVGIDVCEDAVWGSGVGTNALRAFVQYLFANGFDTLYTQTWSGNARMLRLAARLGFTECNRRCDAREVNGTRYDALTLMLAKHPD